MSLFGLLVCLCEFVWAVSVLVCEFVWAVSVFVCEMCTCAAGLGSAGSCKGGRERVCVCEREREREKERERDMYGNVVQTLLLYPTSDPTGP